MNTKQTNKFIALLLTIVLSVGIIPTGLFTLTATAYTGEGKYNNPYIATTYDELRMLMKLAGGEEIHIYLGADIFQEDSVNDYRLETGTGSTYLDLNGHHLSRKTRSLDTMLIYNTSSSFLHISDSSKDNAGGLSFSNSSSATDMDSIILNVGYLEISGGTFNPDALSGLSSLILNCNGGTILISGGNFYGCNSIIIEQFTSSLQRLGLSGMYPFICVTGGVFNTYNSKTISCSVPTFITGGTFINENPQGNFAWGNNFFSSDILVYCGGTFRTGSQNLVDGKNMIKLPGTVQRETSILGSNYYENIPPVVITDGSVTVERHLLDKCIREFVDYYKKPKVTAAAYDEAFSRYPYFFAGYDELDEIEIINKYVNEEIHLSIQNPKDNNSDIFWAQSTDGVNYTEIPGSNGKQTITPPKVTTSGMVYYHCVYTDNFYGGTSADVLRVVYKDRPEGMKIDIENVDVSITPPKEGARSDHSPSISNSANYTVSNASWSRDGYVFNTFELGESYMVYIYLKAKEGYKFSYKTVATLNNIPATVSSWTDDSCTIKYTFPTTLPKTILSSAFATTSTPLVGEPAPEIVNSGNSNIYSVKIDSWLKPDGSKMKSGDVFVAGKTYSAILGFSPKGGYDFSKDATVTVNNIHAVRVESDSTVYYYYKVDFPIQNVIMKTAYGLDIIDLTAPADGVAADYTAAVSETGFSVLEVIYYTDAKPSKILESYKGKLGDNVVVAVKVKCDDDYYFANPCHVTWNGIESFLTVKTLNGEANEKRFHFKYTVAEAPSERLIGDLNGNGKHDSADYLILKRSVLGTFNLNDAQKEVADINGDGKKNATDYLMLKRVVLGTYTLKTK